MIPTSIRFPTDMTDLQQELEFAREIARECGAIALTYLQGDSSGLAARDKPDGGGIVTAADLELNALIVAAVGRHFPRDAALAEESPDDGERLRRPRCWMIDPIDGTREYAAGRSTWAIHIGLAIEGVPRLGVVAEPACQRVSWGVHTSTESSAYCEVKGVRERLCARPNETRLRLVTPRRATDPRIRGFVESVPMIPTRRLGSVGVKLCDVARGESDAYLHPAAGTKLWDTCAPEAILRAAGAVLSDVTGRPLVYDAAAIGHRRGLLAAATTLHNRIVGSVTDQLFHSWISPAS